MNKKALITLLTIWAIINHIAPLCANGLLQADTVVAHTFQCDEPADVCFDLPMTMLNDLLIFNNGLPYSGPIEGCAYDTLVTYTYNTLFGQGTMGPYLLESWQINGMAFSAQFDNIDQLVALMNMWDPTGNWTHDPSMLLIAGGDPTNVYSDMIIKALSNNTMSIVGMNFGLEAQGISLSFDTGTHQVIFLNTQQSTLDTAIVIVECLPIPQTSNYYDTIAASSNLVYCLDTTDLPGNIVSVVNACTDESGSYVSFFLTTDYCVKYQGLKCGGTETACIVLCDDLGFCDTTYLHITVDETQCFMQSEKITDTLFINFERSWCIDTSELPGTVISMENVCPDQSGNSLDFELIDGQWCVRGLAIDIGTDTACVVLRDEFGNTDTTFLCITVLMPTTECLYDTLAIGDTRTWCPDLTQLAGIPTSITNACTTSGGTSALFEIDTLNYCVTAKGISEGIDTACIVICDSYNICDTTCLVIATTSMSPCDVQDLPQAMDDQATTIQSATVAIDVLANDIISSCSPPVVFILDSLSGGTGPTHGTAIVYNDNRIHYTPETGFCGIDNFTYVVCNAAGCDTAQVIVEVSCEGGNLIVFNGFSPNGDGTNDSFVIQNIEQYPENRLEIYNRWGEMVFQARGYQNNWDGSWKGKKLPDGTYFYFLEVEMGEPATTTQLSGYLQIRR